MSPVGGLRKSMEPSDIEKLRIERPPERPAARWPWVLLVLLALALAAVWYVWLRPPEAVEVETLVVRESSNAAGGTVLNASGYVTARLQATVSSKFTAKVTEVLIEEGMSVDKGQVLARLDDSNIRAALDLAEAQRVSEQKGLEETEALLREARLNLERVRKLVERKLASESELDRSRALADSLQAQLERKKADVQVARRQVDIYRQQLEDSIVRAPFAGIVVAKNAQPGEMISPVSAGGGFTRTGIGTVVDMSSLEIEIDVNEAYINRVRPGQEVIATLDAYPDWKIPCQVIAIIPTADRQRATVEVRVGFKQLDERILPDMGVKVAFKEEPETGVVPSSVGMPLPRSAVRSRDGRDYVLVVNNGRLERRAVAVAPLDGGRVLVQSGLAAGEKVVVDGPPGLAENNLVKERSR